MDSFQTTNIASGMLVSQILQLSSSDPSTAKDMLFNAFDLFKSANDFHNLFFTLLCGKEDYPSSIMELRMNAEQLQSVCAKTLTSRDVAWKCEDCELDPTCIICAECFEKSNHEGHRVRLQRGVSGCCDCGDPTAWKTTGFCSDHQGYHEYTDQQVLDLLPEEIGQRCETLFNNLGEYIHTKFLQIEDKSKQSLEARKIETKILFSIGCISNCLEASPLFIHFFTKTLMRIHPYIGSTTHECSCLSYVDEEHKAICENLLSEYDSEIIDENGNHPCKCTLMSLILKYDNDLFYKIVTDSIIFKMFQSLRFKKLLGLAYASNAKDIYQNIMNENSYSHLGVQILTIPEISLMIIQDDQLRNIFLDKFESVSKITRDTPESTRKQFFYLISDIKYILKSNTIQYIINEEGIERFIDIYAKACMIDAMKIRTSHILLSFEGYFLDGLDYSYLSLKIGYIIIREIDYSNLELNQKIATIFFDKICSLDNWWDQNSNSTGYNEIPLLKLFAMYFTKYIMTNVAILEKDLDDTKFKDIKSYRKIIRNLIEGLFVDKSKDNFENLLAIIMKVSARVLGFNDEIKSSKWLYYGEDISLLPRITSDKLSFYFDDPCVLLVQMIFMLSDSPKYMMSLFIEGYSIDGQMRNIFVNMSLQPDEYEHSAGDINKDIRNLRQMMYLLNIILSNDRLALYFWNAKKEHSEYEYDEFISKKIDKRFRKAAQYEAIHTLVRCSDSNIKSIMKNSPKQMTESHMYEKALNDFARCITDREGSKIFSLDKKYTGYFSPYYFSNLNYHSEAVKVFDSFYKNNKSKEKKKPSKNNSPLLIQNMAIGYYIALVRQNMINSGLVTVLINILKYKDMHKFIDEDIIEYAIQVLKVLIEYAEFVQKQAPDQRLVKDMKKNIAQGLKTFTKYKAEYSEFFMLVTGFVDTEDNEESMEEKKKSESENDKKLKRKQMAQKKKLQIMKRMQTNRSNIIEKFGLETGASSTNESMSSISEQDMVEVPKCQKCYEPLNSEEFAERPFGYLATVVKTKLLYFSYKQTYEMQMKTDSRMATTKDQSDLINKLEFLGEIFKECEFLDQDNGGVILQTCNHMTHYECLNSFKVQNLQNRSRTLLIEDMNINEFACPFCKRHCNAIIPPWKELIDSCKSDLIFDDIESYNNSAINNFKNRFNNFMKNKDLSALFGSNSGESVKSSLLSMALDFINIISKVQNGQQENDILPVDIHNKRGIILRTVINYINHSIQLTDVKSLSWILSEKDKIRSLLTVFQILWMYKKDEDTKTISSYFTPINIEKPIHELNVSNIAIESLLKLYFFKTLSGELIEFETISSLLKIAFSLVLLQIAARVIYEKNSFNIKNPNSDLKFEELISVIKDQDVNLTVNGQSIDLYTRFIEGSLSFLRKIVASVIIITGTEETESHSHSKLFKRLENKNFGCDPNKEFFMLMNLMGWLEDEIDQFDFFKIIKEVTQIEQTQCIYSEKLKSYFDDQCGLNSMEVDIQQEEPEDIEEEKISATQSPSSIVKKRNPNVIPEVLYLTTPDFYFKLPELPKILENLTKYYYKKKCSLCKKISKRGAICLMCNDYFCVANCSLDASK